MDLRVRTVYLELLSLRNAQIDKRHFKDPSVRNNFISGNFPRRRTRGLEVFRGGADPAK